jgi:hypothetical protein
MQPYFFPYAGYFRLFTRVEQFIVFDCVQFPRRGRVHRTEVPGSTGTSKWLTLPLTRQPRDTLIRDVAFSIDARARFDERVARLRWISSATGPTADRVRQFLYAPMVSVVDYVDASLRLVAAILRLDVTITRSSALDIDQSLRGEQRVIATAAAVGATHYINLPGGRSLYDPQAFARRGIKLAFLAPYDGRFFQMLPALLTEPPEEIRGDVLRTSILLAE